MSVSRPDKGSNHEPRAQRGWREAHQEDIDDEETASEDHGLAWYLTRWQRVLAVLKIAPSQRALLQYALTWPDFEKFKKKQVLSTIWLFPGDLLQVVDDGMTPNHFYKIAAKASLAKVGVIVTRRLGWLRFEFDDRFLTAFDNGFDYMPISKKEDEPDEVDNALINTLCSEFRHIPREQLIHSTWKYKRYVRQRGRQPTEHGLRKWLSHEENRDDRRARYGRRDRERD